jgi:hypothetical protein
MKKYCQKHFHLPLNHNKIKSACKLILMNQPGG